MRSVRDCIRNGKIPYQLDMNVFEACFPSPVIEEILEHRPPRRNAAGAMIRPRVRECRPKNIMLFQLCCCWWPTLSQRQVWLNLVDALADQHPTAPVRQMGDAALSAQRRHLGWKPFAELLTRCARPLSQPEQPDAFVDGMRLMAIDGSLFNVADTPANARAFRRSRNQYGQGAYPQARVVMLMEVGSRAVIDAVIGGYEWGEANGVAHLVQHAVTSNMLVLGDAGTFSGFVAESCRAQGAHLLCALASTTLPTVKERLSDGSYLAVLSPSRDSKYRAKAKQTLRVIEYTVSDARLGKAGQRYRLVTTLLDEKQYPATRLIELYRQRWQVELMIREIKTTLHQGRTVLRSRTPKGVKQELLALLLAHYGLRYWMMAASRQWEQNPTRLSARHCLQHLKRRVERVSITPVRQRAPMLTRLREVMSQETLPDPVLGGKRRERKQIYSKYPPKKQKQPAYASLGPTENYLSSIEIVVRPLPEKRVSQTKKKATLPSLSGVA